MYCRKEMVKIFKCYLIPKKSYGTLSKGAIFFGQPCIYTHFRPKGTVSMASSNGRSSSNAGGNVVEPAFSLVTPESNRMQFDLIHHILRLM